MGIWSVPGTATSVWNHHRNCYGSHHPAQHLLLPIAATDETVRDETKHINEESLKPAVSW